MKKHIIFDTDIGIDSDDAIALSILLWAESRGYAKIEAIGASTERCGATATIKAICNYFGREIPTGRIYGANLECDKINTYSSAVMDKYNTQDTDCDAVKLYRKTLAEAKEKITIIAVGPLTSISKLLKSTADEYSSLSGIELVKEKADALYIMGGQFKQNNAIYQKAPEYTAPEWNIKQDIEAAKFVAEFSPVRTVWCPFEAGEKVLAYASDVETPTNYAMRVLWKYYKRDENETASRSCWDPITCLTAVCDVSQFFEISRCGTVVVNDDGVTEWKDENGLHSYLVLREGYQGCANVINDILRDTEAI